MTNRITLEDNLLTAMTKLAEGIPGAAVVLANLVDVSPLIDPQAAFGGFAPLFALDSLGIYGSRIWLLWRDVCNHDPVKMITLLRAHQLGIISRHLVESAAITGAHEFHFDDLLGQVRAQIGQFAEGAK